MKANAFQILINTSYVIQKLGESELKSYANDVKSYYKTIKRRADQMIVFAVILTLYISDPIQSLFPSESFLLVSSSTLALFSASLCATSIALKYRITMVAKRTQRLLQENKLKETGKVCAISSNDNNWKLSEKVTQFNPDKTEAKSRKKISA